MTLPILYCGDTDLTGAAGYLAGLLTHFALGYEYVPSHVPLSREQVEQPRSLFVFSDYPALQVADELQRPIVEQVRAGAGLLMIGGWESFHGLGGDWDITEIARILPVQMSRSDDRVNFDQPALLCPYEWREEPWGLPWFRRPPTIGGMNRVTVRPEGTEVLVVRPFSARWNEEVEILEWHPQPETLPALVTGQFGLGRTAAFLPDVAPHWVGGFVDWGDARVTAQAPGAGAIEVGNWYAEFWRQLVGWTMAGER
ncbi:MAG: glutamine amidotransferase [Planctomycetaceae bacterium]|nr:glutamine amidotransferase [Planctomycetaceae bacterium]